MLPRLEFLICISKNLNIPGIRTKVIYSPSVLRLRQYQISCGLDIIKLRTEQQGIAPVTRLHHISMNGCSSTVRDGDLSNSQLQAPVQVPYRVRICRTCSKQKETIDLGTYADLESALLINDAHEILNSRFNHLHLLCPDDLSFLSYITVRKRGEFYDQPLCHILQQREIKRFQRRFRLQDCKNVKRDLNSCPCDQLEQRRSRTHDFDINESSSKKIKTTTDARTPASV